MAYKKSPFKMSGKSPFMKALVGKQNNLPDALKEKILASPAKQTKRQIEEYRSKSEYLDPSVKRRKNVSDKQVIKEIESQESTMGRAKFKTKGDVKAVQSMQALSPGKYDHLFEAKAIEKFKNSPAKQVEQKGKAIRKKIAKKATDTAIDMVAGPIGRLPGIKDKVQSFKNKKNKALGLGVTYKESYADADKKKYPSYDSFEKDAKSYNKKKSPAKQKDIKIKDLPDQAVKAGKKIVKGVKKLSKKIGNIKLSTEEGQKRRQKKRDLRAKQKAEKNSPAKKYGKSPSKKKGCSKKY